MPEFSEPLTWLCILIGYVVGATPFGLIVGKMRGIDIREHGSGNIGATNVLRTLGKPVGISVLVLDILKGMIPVLIAMAISESTIVHIVTAIATILGHNYTFWLKFKGGKGIATTAGAMILLIPVPALFSILSWIIVFKITRYVSLGSIAAALALPIVGTIQALVTGNWDWAILLFCLILCVLAIWKHRGNIDRLMKGEEARFQKKSERKAPD
ncbi:MAG: glycerol-3-phosphate 1-O-acyltransferase PlsY [Verrucomicrobiales bacterium]|nr:glycerol-3-phosphate 1-O-acyltransferase PlsY [Verrucomicrobiales bacterium]